MGEFAKLSIGKAEEKGGDVASLVAMVVQGYPPFGNGREGAMLQRRGGGSTKK